MWNFSSLSSSYYYGSIVRLRRIRAWFFDVKYVWKSEVLQQSHRKMPDKLLVSAFSPCCRIVAAGGGLYALYLLRSLL
jgi:hypothetical protein